MQTAGCAEHMKQRNYAEQRELKSLSYLGIGSNRHNLIMGNGCFHGSFEVSGNIRTAACTETAMRHVGRSLSL